MTRQQYLESGGSKTRIATKSNHPIEFRCINCLIYVLNKKYCKKTRIRKKFSDYCKHSFQENIYMKFLNFQQDYFKPRKNVFTAVIGKNSFSTYDINHIIKIRKKGRFYCFAKIIEKKQCKIFDMSLNSLRHEADYNNHFINSHDEYIEHINNCGPRNKFKDAIANNQTIVTILTIKKIKIY